MAAYKDLFISYGRRESLNFVARLHQKLKLAGYDAWFDKVNIPDGEDYAARINYGIESAYNFVYVMAPRSLTSPYCLIEIEYARFLGKRVIPINQMVIFNTVAQELAAGDQQVLRNFYAAHGIPEPHIENTQQVLNRSLELVGQTDWLDGKTQLSDADCDEMAGWAQQYENHWHKHDDPDYLRNVALPRFGTRIDSLDSVTERMSIVLERHKDYVQLHCEVLNCALIWQRNQNETRYLPVGKQRELMEAWFRQRFEAGEQAPCVITDLQAEFICEADKNANNLTTSVFISYADENRTLMQDVRTALQHALYTVWTNKTDIKSGVAFEEAVLRGVEEADNLLFLISPQSIQSKYCLEELNHAFSYNKRILCLLIADTDIDSIPEAIRMMQFIDCREDMGNGNLPRRSGGLSRLLRSLDEEADYYRHHKLLLLAALKWQRQKNAPGLLFRGHNLHHFDNWLRVARVHDHHPALEIQEQFIQAGLNQPAGLSQEVFISYSRTDSDLARRLNLALQELGKTTWFDQESIPPGADFQQEIHRGIRNADNFLFIISPDSVNSPYCADEVEYAHSLHKRFITILHRPVDNAELHPELARVQWLDFNCNSFDSAFRDLVGALDVDRGHVQKHTVWLQRAMEWEKKGYSADLLLRGDEFVLADNWALETRQKHKTPPVTPVQERFIDTSRQAINIHRQQQKHAMHRLRGLLTASLAGLIVAVLSSLVAFRFFSQAEQQQEHLSIQNLTQQAVSNVRTNPVQALRDALQAYVRAKAEYSGLSRAETGLREVLQYNSGSVLPTGAQTQRILAAAISDEGNYLGVSGNLRIPSPAARTPMQKLSRGLGMPPPEPVLWQGRVSVWKLDDNKTLADSFELPQAAQNGLIGALAFAPGECCVVLGNTLGTLQWWKIGAEKAELGQSVKSGKGAITALQFSADGAYLAVSHKDARVTLWAADSKGLHFVKELSGTGGLARNLSFSPHGQWLAVLGLDDSIRLWSLPIKDGLPDFTLRRQGRTDIPPGLFPGLVWRAPLSGNSAPQPVWTNYRRFPFDKNVMAGATGALEVQAAAFNPDRQWLISADMEGRLQWWNLNQNNPFYTAMQQALKQEWRVFDRNGLFARDLDNTTLPVSRQSSLLRNPAQACGNDESSANGSAGFARLPRRLRQISFNRNGKRLFALGADNQLYYWRTDKAGWRGHSITLNLNGTGETIQNLLFSEHTDYLMGRNNNGGTLLWSLLDSPPQVNTLPYQALAENGISLLDAAGFPAVLGQNKLWYYNSVAGKYETLPFSPPGKDMLKALFFERQRDQAVLASENGLMLWNSARQRFSPRHDLSAPAQAFAMQKDNGNLWILAASAKGTIEACRWTPQGLENGYLLEDISMEGDDWLLRQMQSLGGGLFGKRNEPSGNAYDYSDSGADTAAGNEMYSQLLSRDGHIQAGIWLQPEKRKMIKLWRLEPEQGFRRHFATFYVESDDEDHLALSGSGKLLAGGNADGKVWLLDLQGSGDAQKTPVLLPVEHGKAVSALAFSHDERYLAVAAQGNRILILPAASTHVELLACAGIGYTAEGCSH